MGLHVILNENREVNSRGLTYLSPFFKFVSSDLSVLLNYEICHAILFDEFSLFNQEPFWLVNALVELYYREIGLIHFCYLPQVVHTEFYIALFDG